MNSQESIWEQIKKGWGHKSDPTQPAYLRISLHAYKPTYDVTRGTCACRSVTSPTIPHPRGTHVAPRGRQTQQRHHHPKKNVPTYKASANDHVPVMTSAKGAMGRVLDRDLGLMAENHGCTLQKRVSDRQCPAAAVRRGGGRCHRQGDVWGWIMSLPLGYGLRTPLLFNLCPVGPTKINTLHTKLVQVVRCCCLLGRGWLFHDHWRRLHPGHPGPVRRIKLS